MHAKRQYWSAIVAIVALFFMDALVHAAHIDSSSINKQGTQNLERLPYLAYVLHKLLVNDVPGQLLCLL